MRRHLTLVSLDSHDPTDQRIGQTIGHWASCNLAQTIGIVDRSAEDLSRVQVRFLEDGDERPLSIDELLTERLWRAITVISCQSRVDAADDLPPSLDTEVVNHIRAAFAANREIVIRSTTLRIADPAGGLATATFSSRFDLHLLHEPQMLADTELAAVPVRPETAPLVQALTALIVGGGFAWMPEPTIGDLKDLPNGNTMPARVVRSCMRVVSGGRLSDAIIAGAFPESGPWSVPPEAGQVRPAPVGAAPPPSVAAQLAGNAEFRYLAWPKPELPTVEPVGLWKGLKLFLRHFVKVLLGVPAMLVDSGKVWVGTQAERVLQNLTFGDNSSMVLRYRPGSPADDIEVVELLQRAAMPDSEYPMADPRPWESLSATAFGLVDGGELPEGIDAPSEGPRRLIYVDPRAIGPSPTLASFEIPSAQSALLGLPETVHAVEPVDVAGATAVDSLLAMYRSGVPASQAETAGILRASPTTQPPSDPDLDSELATAARHAPAHPRFNPSEYLFVTMFYQGSRSDVQEQYSAQNRKWEQVRATKQAVTGPWTENKRCDHCGTRFQIGAVYEHGPSGYLIHLGNVCARKAYPAAAQLEAEQESINQLESRWRDWKSGQQTSLLWRVGEHIESGISSARTELSAALDLAQQPSPTIADEQTRMFRRLRRHGVFALFTLIAGIAFGVVVGAILALVSMVYIVVGLVLILAGWLLRYVILVRNIARLQWKLQEADIARVQAMRKASHDSRELARLVTARQQFVDWQKIIREIVHAPFGRIFDGLDDSEIVRSIDRPQNFVYAEASPSNEQLVEAQLRAKAVTVHKGWLMDIFITTRSHWAERYRRLRLADASEDVRPESDNSWVESVVGTTSVGTLYNARSDFRMRLQAGEMRPAIIGERIQMILSELAERRLDSLLSDVRIKGPGAALSRRSPHELLAGLGTQTPPDFPAAIFGPLLALRTENVALSISGPIEGQYLQSDSLTPGRSLMAASWRLDVSPPVEPMLVAAPSPRTEDSTSSPGGDSAV